jgi:predicted metal-binding membrane protein
VPINYLPSKTLASAAAVRTAEFITRHYRPGIWGAARLGLLHGAYCVGCCWLLMALLFVGVVMNLLWVAGLTLLIAAEKLLPGGPWIARFAGWRWLLGAARSC